MANRFGVHLNIWLKRETNLEIIKFLNRHVQGEGNLPELNGYLLGQMDVQWSDWNYRSLMRETKGWHLLTAAADSGFEQKKFLFFLNELVPSMIVEPGKIIAVTAGDSYPTQDTIYWVDENNNICYRTGYIYNQNPEMDGPWPVTPEMEDRDRQYLTHTSPWKTNPLVTYGGDTNLSIPGTEYTQHYVYTDNRPTMSPKQELKRIARRQYNEQYAANQAKEKKDD